MSVAAPLLALMLAAAAAAYDEPLRAAPEQGMLFLHNGQVLSGKITLAGDRYYVAVPQGELRIRKADVEIFARDVAEAYRLKRSLTLPDRAEDHIALAEWCIRRQLFDEAAAELAVAETVDPTHPKIPLIRRRAELAREKPPPAAERPAAPVELGPTNNELDRLVRGMPEGTVETFTRDIQPLLLNRCATAGCHGPRTEQPWRMLRAAAGRQPSKRITQRNLHATLGLIDREDPESSALLTSAARPHATSEVPVFGDREIDQYRELAEWVYQVAGREPDERPTEIDDQAPALLQNLKARPLPRSDADARSDLEAIPATLEVPGAARRSRQTPDEAAPGRSSSKRPAAYAPVDPFDPEIFNRRYFGPADEVPLPAPD